MADQDKGKARNYLVTALCVALIIAVTVGWAVGYVDDDIFVAAIIGGIFSAGVGLVAWLVKKAKQCIEETKHRRQNK